MHARKLSKQVKVNKTEHMVCKAGKESVSPKYGNRALGRWVKQVSVKYVMWDPGITGECKYVNARFEEWAAFKYGEDQGSKCAQGK